MPSVWGVASRACWARHCPERQRRKVRIHVGMCHAQGEALRVALAYGTSDSRRGIWILPLPSLQPLLTHDFRHSATGPFSSNRLSGCNT
eukprot:5316299-Prymnesium_polylepis.2